MSRSAKRDFGTLRTTAIAEAGIADFEAAESESERAECLAGIIARCFDDYYARSRRIPWLAKEAFEARDWPTAVALSQERIAIFSLSVNKAAPVIAGLIPKQSRLGDFWRWVEGRVRIMMGRRYEADLALAYLASIRRLVHQDLWAPISYRFEPTPHRKISFLSRLFANGPMTAEMVKFILEVPDLEAPFADLDRDAALVAARINHELAVTDDSRMELIEVIRAGFYRNRGAYVVGSLVVGGVRSPMALALLHKENGIEVDAVILRESTLRHVFSSTLANFHVTVTEYHQLVDYLHGLMPARPRGMHFSTVGYNHVGKLAVMEQLREGLTGGGDKLDHAPGPRGSVAIGFTAPSLQYVLKVIRDEPTDQYKWGTFDGVETVLRKYRRVHEQNRSGSMLDNIIYSNLSLPGEMFGEELQHELLDKAPGTVSQHGGQLFFSHLIVQRKLTPVPLYLQSCSPSEAAMVVIRLGQCIRNNAATNVFNKDLDGRNYGVSSLRFVYLFDYDAVETLTEVKVRTNLDRYEGEEDIPDWFFEEGPIFLPEELEAHLRLPNRGLRRLFREAHGELLTLDYWVRMQKLLAQGRVPRVRTYPRACQLNSEEPAANLSLTL
ncbi:MAG: isocitrate dehydrogenase kinase/phosphatase AceK regulatory subunit [Pseudomonadota bacterium]